MEYKYIKVALTIDGYNKVKEKASEKGKKISGYIREITETQNELDIKQRKKIITIDKNLLYELNRISSNINQIAKKVNIYKELDEEILETLVKFEKHLESIKNDYSI